MLLSQEPVNLYMTFALISFGVTSLSEKYCPILKDLNTTLVFTFKSFPILHNFANQGKFMDYVKYIKRASP